ncbi:MAG: amidohydrolase family protein [Candidatus Dormibacteria bacterium]
MILDGATIITMDAGRRIFARGALVVRADRIVAVGPADEILSAHPDEERVDVSGRLIIPGLIDTHVHQAQAMIRDCADDMALVQWLCERVWVLQGSYDHQDGVVSARLCIAEMLKSGTTTFLESGLAHRYGFEGVAQVVADTGIRACLSKKVMDIATYASEDNAMPLGLRETRAESLLTTLDMFDRWNGAADGRIRVGFGPRTPGGVSPELYREMVSEARARGMGITMHLAEVEADRQFLRQTYQMSPVEFARSVGLVGPDVVLVHMVWLDDQDIGILAETGTSVSHNPSSNSKLASGVCPVPRLLAAGVNVALGCDGGPSNNTYDLLAEMKLAALVHKAVSLDPTVVPAETVLEMATINGARALRWDHEIGSLEVGKKADIVVVNRDRCGLSPGLNPVSSLVYSATGADVDSVMVDGRWLVRHGQLLTIDEEEAVAQARERARRLYAATGIDPSPRWPVL